MIRIHTLLFLYYCCIYFTNHQHVDGDTTIHNHSHNHNAIIPCFISLRYHFNNNQQRKNEIYVSFRPSSKHYQHRRHRPPQKQLTILKSRRGNYKAVDIIQKSSISTLSRIQETTITMWNKICDDADHDNNLDPDHENNLKVRSIENQSEQTSLPSYGSTAIDHDNDDVSSTGSCDPLDDSTEHQHQIQNDDDDGSIGKRILNLAIPAGAALLIDPMMNVIDTIFVGRYYIPPMVDAATTTVPGASGVAAMASYSAAPLAGIGSASAILTFIFYLCNFLCTATTPLIAQQRSSGNKTNAIQISGQAISLSLLLGIFIIIILMNFGPYILYNIMGTSNTGIDANRYAIQFLSIRSLAAPAILCIEASTGILRGFLDTKTPVYVLILANIINFVLDVIFIVQLNMGPTGAAIATDVAEWISAILFLGILAGYIPSATINAEIGKNQKMKNLIHRSQDLIVSNNPSENESSLDSNIEKENSSTSFVSIVPLASIPSYDDIKPLMTASSSILFRSLMLQLSLAGAAAMAARSSGDNISSSAVAAHQIGIQLWLLCSFFCDSLAAASQGLIADAIGRNNQYDVRAITKTIFIYSSYLGIGLAILLQIGLSTNWLIELFTRDVSTQYTLRTILPYIIIAQPLNAFVFAADGILQGASQFPYQAKAMTISVLVAALTFFFLETTTLTTIIINENDASTILSNNNSTLVHVWIALLILQAMRGVTSIWKIIDRNGPIDILHKEIM